ncbi:hypothetical protein A3D11_01040 [Candidatus Peribacteria bacterium RIFCSPHIGHO2_02_FULL_49_16]|nr:MAG: hypothetical protein A2880_00095 [Candidatus Peribacteria bacterium RIFCSPHIGHO2_01_FULL_49_38]OGJ59738.1 MAG: hypothetical protein A3D11_01040 [Candidatus Peribacteria bacterium RIFCSPHIGHO2_02_FULL_49_16]
MWRFNWFIWFVAFFTELVMLPVGCFAFVKILWINTFDPEEASRVFGNPTNMGLVYGAMAVWFFCTTACHYIRLSLEK